MVDASSTSSPGPVDIFRDTPVRYLGYANELGESFRLVAPWCVAPSYVISALYVLGDTVSKGRAASAAQSGLTAEEVAKQPSVGATVVDTLVWQTLASVMVPGYTIHSVVKATNMAVQSQKASIPLVARRWLPTAVGLGCIPLVIHPIDHFVHWAMDNTCRPLYFGR
jgi:fission process protein 1